MPYPLADMTLYFFIYSFCGWLMETALCSVQERRFVNRGFVGGPICPIYGCGVLLMLIFLIPVRDGVDNMAKALPVVFLTGAALASTVEYVTSWGMEKLFHARWWDYSHMKFNVGGRICLQISLIWGGLATMFLYWVQPQFESLVSTLYALGNAIPGIVASGLAMLFVADVVVSFFVAQRIGNKLEQLDKWAEMIGRFMESLELPTKEEILHQLEDAYERLTARHEDEAASEWHMLAFDALRHRLAEYAAELHSKREELMAGTRYLQRRMLRAFPHMKWLGENASLRDWKEHLPASHKGWRKNSKTDDSDPS